MSRAREDQPDRRPPGTDDASAPRPRGNFPEDGSSYPLAISHLTKGTKTLYLSVSGGPARPITVTGKSTTIPATTTVSVTLNAGPHTLRFSNDTAAGPDLDRVVVP